MAGFPYGQSVMAAAVRAFDWEANPLGPMEHWPASLKTVVSLMLESEFPKALVWGPELITLHNDAFLEILGHKPPALGRPFSEIWAEVWDTIGPIADRAFAGEATYIADFPLVVNRSGVDEQAYFTFCYSPVRDETGAAVGMMDTVIETTSTVVAKQTDTVLRRELVHRVKNIIAVTSSVVNSSLRNAVSLDDAQVSVSQRIDALGRAQSLMAEVQSEITVDNVIRDTLAPLTEDWERLTLDGPHVVLQPQHNMALSLALYELGTNALKYGALLGTTGKVAISWAMEPSGDFSFEWREIGGPPVSPPSRTGFGSRLTSKIVPAYFSGQGQLDYQPSGIRYVLQGSSL